MSKFGLVAFSNAQQGRDEEYRAWYEREHVRDVLSVPGFVAATRLRLIGTERKPQPESPFAAIYALQAEDDAAALAAMGEVRNRSLSGHIRISSAMDRSAGVLTLARKLAGLSKQGVVGERT